MPDAKASPPDCARIAQTGPILWDDHPDFLVALKPAGENFHNEGTNEGFVTRIKRLPGCEGLHPVHRLDRITSGLLLLARHADAARALGTMFEAGAIDKYYLALSEHKPTRKQGWVRGGMARARNGCWRLTREGEYEARTQFLSYSVRPGLRLFVLRPHTGRTHQLRVALKSLSAPILGDERYGGSAADRGYLHAGALRFEWQGVCFCFLQPPEEGSVFCEPMVREQIESLSPPWALPWPG